MLHQGALGDFLFTLPVLEALHRSYPLVRIDLWSKAEHVAVLAEKTYIGKTHPPDDLELVPFFHEELWREARIPRFFEDALAILIFGQAGSRVLGGRLAERLSCPVHWIQSFPEPGRHRHVHDFLLEQCQQLGWPLKASLPDLRPTVHEVSLIKEKLGLRRQTSFGQPILIHPGSGGLRKIWPLNKWWEILRFLRGQYHYPIYLTLGPADEQLRGFAKEAGKLEVLTLEGLTVSNLAALLSECRLYMGSDSGVSHLAALVGIPAVVIFGPTDPDIWAPRGSKVHIVKECWEESEVLTWSPSSESTSLSSHIIELIRRLLPSPLTPWQRRGDAERG
ncbi:MAG TPA: glycosyltransferase family 9 protein [Desulfomonilaceae bacterium]|nr:glycosyltransferase family 9 protein [Desulfomonilaceae bacterium]